MSLTNSDLKLLFLINGDENSAAGVRANMFAQRFPSEWEVNFQYRPARKWQGILPFIWAALRSSPNIIYVMDTAYTGVLAGYLAQKLLGCRLITDTGDAAYALAKSRGIYSNLQLWLINWIEQLALNHSDYLVVRGSYHQSWLESQNIFNVIFIPDGVDPLTTKPAAGSDLRKTLDLEGYLVLGLIGSMLWDAKHHMCYGWDVVEALAFLKDVPVKALLIGDGPGRSHLEQRTQELGVSDRIVFTGQIPYAEVPRYLAAIDICVSTQSNDLVGMVRTTGKLPLYLACGKYVVATDVGEARRVLPGVGCLLPYTGVRDDEHPRRLAEQVKNILKQPQQLEVAAAARQVALDNFDYQILTQKLIQTCQLLVNQP